MVRNGGNLQETLTPSLERQALAFATHDIVADTFVALAPSSRRPDELAESSCRRLSQRLSQYSLSVSGCGILSEKARIALPARKNR
jgi:hypothetical protein